MAESLLFKLLWPKRSGDSAWARGSVLEPCLGDITERKETKNVKMLNMDLHLDFKNFFIIYFITNQSGPAEIIFK